uniref:Uncharacterized protein n=1 Tax=Propithecus coquereli TaxID=379532 RepID=A0A2K6G0P7_PROCO
MVSSSNWLSWVNVLVMAYGRRQITRSAMRSTRGSHVPVGHNAPKDLKEEIDIQLCRVQDIKHEPWLLANDGARLLQLASASLMGKNFHSYLLDLRNTTIPFKGVHEMACCGAGVFGQNEYLCYQEALSELATMVKARTGSSQHQHQSAVKDLTQSPEVSPTTIPVTCLPSSQKSKRAKHFLKLKSSKDNYSTLESTP